MAFFLVHTAVTPPDWNQGELDALQDKERLVADELQQNGVLVALWRETGQLAAYGIWHGHDRQAVEASVALLPFRGFMTVEITELSNHPYAVNSFPFGLEA
jgi:muconolactone delta-isomerase